MSTRSDPLSRQHLALAVRTSLITEQESKQYWGIRNLYRSLSDTNNPNTIASRTQQYNEARERIVNKLNQPGGEINRERTKRSRVESELAQVKRQRAEMERALREKEQMLQALQFPHHAGNAARQGDRDE